MDVGCERTGHAAEDGVRNEIDWLAEAALHPIEGDGEAPSGGVEDRCPELGIELLVAGHLEIGGPGKLIAEVGKLLVEGVLAPDTDDMREIGALVIQIRQRLEGELASVMAGSEAGLAEVVQHDAVHQVIFVGEEPIERGPGDVACIKDVLDGDVTNLPIGSKVIESGLQSAPSSHVLYSSQHVSQMIRRNENVAYSICCPHITLPVTWNRLVKSTPDCIGRMTGRAWHAF